MTKRPESPREAAEALLEFSRRLTDPSQPPPSSRALAEVAGLHLNPHQLATLVTARLATLATARRAEEEVIRARAELAQAMEALAAELQDQ